MRMLPQLSCIDKCPLNFLVCVTTNDVTHTMKESQPRVYRHVASCMAWVVDRRAVCAVLVYIHDMRRGSGQRACVSNLVLAACMTHTPLACAEQHIMHGMIRVQCLVPASVVWVRVGVGPTVTF